MYLTQAQAHEKRLLGLLRAAQLSDDGFKQFYEAM